MASRSSRSVLLGVGLVFFGGRRGGGGDYCRVDCVSLMFLGFESLGPNKVPGHGLGVCLRGLQLHFLQLDFFSTPKRRGGQSLSIPVFQRSAVSFCRGLCSGFRACIRESQSDSYTIAWVIPPPSNCP